MKTFKLIIDESLSQRASDIARDKHWYQYRKFSKEPYFKHPSRVADILSRFTKDEEIIAAGYLHDTLEDTETSFEELEATFGKRVANLVKELTSVKKDQVKIGKAKYLLKKMNSMSDSALLIKLVDRLDNVSDFRFASDKFIKKYIDETMYILNNLKRPLNKNKRVLIQEIVTHLKIWENK